MSHRPSPRRLAVLVWMLAILVLGGLIFFARSIAAEPVESIAVQGTFAVPSMAAADGAFDTFDRSAVGGWGIASSGAAWTGTVEQGEVTDEAWLVDDGHAILRATGNQSGDWVIPWRLNIAAPVEMGESNELSFAFTFIEDHDASLNPSRLWRFECGDAYVQVDNANGMSLGDGDAAVVDVEFNEQLGTVYQVRGTFVDGQSSVTIWPVTATQPERPTITLDGAAPGDISSCAFETFGTQHQLVIDNLSLEPTG